jgi:hypothetical protein
LEKAFQEQLLQLHEQAQDFLEKAVDERSKILEENYRWVEQQRNAEYKEAERRIALEKEVCTRALAARGPILTHAQEMQMKEDSHIQRLRVEMQKTKVGLGSLCRTYVQASKYSLGNGAGIGESKSAPSQDLVVVQPLTFEYRLWQKGMKWR